MSNETLIVSDFDLVESSRSKQKSFTFDLLFGEDAAQAEIFAKTAQPMVQPILNGFNSTVFAYGATGAGKTHTMIGTRKDPGIMFYTVNALFDQIHMESGFQNYEVKMSFLEIYNETLRDLLKPSMEQLDISEDP